MSGKRYSGTVLKGAVTMIMVRWLNRALGLISISVTARILTPDDFGVMGSAALVLGMFLTLKGAGLGEVIVHLDRVDKGHLNTVWSLKLLITLGICLLVISGAPFLSSILEEPRLPDVLTILVLGTVIGQLQSPATTLLLREFSYKKILILRFSEKLLSVSATIIMALILRDYWALVYGKLIAACLAVVVSYLVCPFTPYFTLSTINEVRKFAFWSVWRDIAVYFAQIADELVVRLNNPTEVFAYYRTGRDLSRMAVSELVAPAASPVFAALSRLQGDVKRFEQATTAAIGSGIIIAIPAAIGLHFLAADIVYLVLGKKWVSVAPLLQFLAFGVAAQTLAGLARSVYAAVGRQNVAAITWTIRAALIAIACVFASASGGIEFTAKVFALTSVIITFTEYGYLYKMIGQKYPIKTLYFGPFLAGMLMALFLYTNPFGFLEIVFIKIFLTAFFSATIYAIVLLGYWRYRGYPSGPVSAIVNQFPNQLKNRIYR